MWIVASLCLLVVLLFAVQYIPFVQRKLVSAVKDFYKSKTNTELGLERVYILPNGQIHLRGANILDDRNNPFINAYTVKADIQVLDLLKGDFIISEAEVLGGVVHIEKRKSGEFNFDFLVDAFTPDKPSTNKKGGAFIVEEVLLENVGFTFSDRKSKLYTGIKVKLLETRFTIFDPKKQIFHTGPVKVINGNGFLADLSEGSIPKTSAHGPAGLPDVFFSSVRLLNTSYLVYIKDDNITVSSYAGELNAYAKEFDLNRSIMDFTAVSIRNGGTYVTQGERLDTTSSGTSQDWTVKADNVSFVNNYFRYDDLTKPELEKGFDGLHLDFKKLNLIAGNVVNVGTTTHAHIKSGSLISGDELSLNSFSGQFRISENEISAQNFTAVTNRSSLKGDFQSNQPSYSSFSADPSSVQYKIRLEQSKVSPSDLIYFSPNLDSVPMIAFHRNSTFGVKGNAKGTMDSLSLNNLHASFSNSFVHTDGSLKNLDEPKSIAYSFQIHKAYITANAIQKLLPDTMLPKNIQIPDENTLTGSISGSPQQTNFDAKVVTTNGDAAVKGWVDSTQTYDLLADLLHLDLGTITRNRKNLGSFTGSIEAKGTSFNIDSAVADVKLNLTSAEIKRYAYQNLQGDLTLDHGNLEGKVTVNDPAARLTAEGKGKLKSEGVDLDIRSTIDTLDLYALKLSKDTFSLKGKLDVLVKGKNLDNFETTGNATALQVQRSKLKITPDSLQFTGHSKDNAIAFNIESQILNANVKGTGKLSTLADDITARLNSYFTISNNIKDSVDTDHRLEFKVDVKQPGELALLVDPTLTLAPLTIQGTYDGFAKTIEATAQSDFVSVKGYNIDTISLSIKGDADKLTASATTPQIAAYNMLFPNPSIGLTASNDSIKYNVGVKGNDGVQRLLVGGTVKNDKGVYTLSIAEDQFVLNNKKWNVTPGNKIVIDSNKISVNDFLITHGDQMLRIDQSGDQAVTVRSKDLELMDISSIADSNKYITGGKLTGEMNLSMKGDIASSAGNFSVKDFNFRKDTLGDLSMELTPAEGSALAIKLGLSGRGNSIKTEGLYNPEDKFATFDFRIAMDQLNVATLKPLLKGAFEDMHGYAKADLKLRGNFEYPLIDGDIDISDVSLLPRFTRSWVRIRQQNIHADQSSFLFKNFLMTDSLNDPALVNGYICPEHLPHFTFDLSVVTSNFLFLNTGEGDSEQYFGRAFVTSVSHVRGNDVTPFIDINAKLNSGSRMTLLIPEQKLRETQRGDIVQFVTLEVDSARKFLKKRREEPSFAGITLNSNIEVDENSEFKLLIDPIAGDSLSVKGKTTFSYGIDPGGKMSMTGVYEVTEGSYLLTLTRGLKRRFDLQKGSKITWTGDPINPELDVSAIYTVRAAPYDLVIDDLTGQTDVAVNAYRQEMPFLVNLKMKGALDRPAISFEVNLPSDQQGALQGSVYARLNQLNQNESELNTQVLSLLALNRFYNETEFVASQAPTISAYTRTGASRVLTQGLNAFATTYANFVELQLDVDFYENYYQGEVQRSTNMKVGVGRKFFADRLDVRAGGTVVVQGNASTETANDLPSLVTAEYKLTRDGRYRLTGFRKNTYEGVFEGQIIREGAGIVFIRDFNRFGDLFRKPEERDLLDAAPRPRP